MKIYKKLFNSRYLTHPSAVLRNIFIAMIFFLAAFLFNYDQKLARPLEGKKVHALRFEGLRNTDQDDLIGILDDFGIKQGKIYRSVGLNEAVKKIISDTAVNYIKVDGKEQQDGILLTFYCKESPIINEIKFVGIDELYETELLEAIPLKEGDVLNEASVNHAKRLILQKYQEEGLFLASIEVQRKVNEKENKMDIIFKIDEGEVIKVEKIEISGTETLDPEDLKDAMEIEEDGFFSDGSFSQQKYEADRIKILDYMRKEGFRDAEITSSPKEEISFFWKDEKKEKRAIHIKISVREGKKYFFNGYSIRFDITKSPDGKEDKPLFRKRELMELFLLDTPGEIFDDEKFRRDRQSISMMYAGKGHIFARIIPNISYNDKEVVIDKKKFLPGTLIKTEFVIKEGPVAKVENIIIKGNKKTKEKVIRREILIKSGEVFNSFKIQRSRERIYNLGFFKEVNLDARPGSREPFMNLIVEVVEQPTGTISLGGGYGTQSGFSIFTEVAENNLMGNGQRLSGRFEYGPLRKQIQTAFRDPWIVDNLPISMYISVYYVLYTYAVTTVAPGSNIDATYDKSTFGGSVGFGYRFWIFWGTGISFGVKRSTVLDATGAAADAVFQQISLGPQYQNSVTLSLYRDTRDNVFNTTRGLKTYLSYEITGWWGDDHFTRLSPTIEYYFTPFHLPYLRSHPTVFLLRASADFTFKPLWDKRNQRVDNSLVELDDKLYVGGVETVRGWDYVDDYFSDYPKQNHWVDGGDHRILYGVEYRIPIEPSIIWFVTFIDAGGLWDAYETSASTVDLGENLSKKTLAKDYFVYSYGFGIRIQIPVLPIRLYLAKRVIYKGKREDGSYYGTRGFVDIGDLNFVFGIGDVRF